MLPDDALEALFDQARRTDFSGRSRGMPGNDFGGDFGLPAGLSARILADADRLTAEREAQALAARAAARASAPLRLAVPGMVPAGAGMAGGMLSGGGMGLDDFWHQLSRALGGMRAVAGLVAVTAAGLWFGLMPPDALQTGLENAFGSTISANPYLVDSTTAFDFLQTDEGLSQ